MQIRTPKLPLQPFAIDSEGKARFVPNRIVAALLKHGQKNGLGLNELGGRLDIFTQAEWEQFYSLIGYSLKGFHELSMVSDETALYATAEACKQWPDVLPGCRDGGCPAHSGVERQP